MELRFLPRPVANLFARLPQANLTQANSPRVSLLRAGLPQVNFLHANFLRASPRCFRFRMTAPAKGVDPENGRTDGICSARHKCTTTTNTLMIHHTYGLVKENVVGSLFRIGVACAHGKDAAGRVVPCPSGGANTPAPYPSAGSAPRRASCGRYAPIRSEQIHLSA